MSVAQATSGDDHRPPVKRGGVALGRSDATAPYLTGAERTASQTGPDLVDAVLSLIRAAGRPLSHNEILASTGIADTHWTPVIQDLRSCGLKQIS